MIKVVIALQLKYHILNVTHEIHCKNPRSVGVISRCGLIGWVMKK